MDSPSGYGTSHKDFNAVVTERVVQQNEQRSKFRNTWTKRLFAKLFLCKFGALAYVVIIQLS